MTDQAFVDTPQEVLETSLRPKPSVCVVDNRPIDDAPGVGNLGYVGLRPSVTPRGYIVPAHLRTLCKAHYLAEHAEVYPESSLPELV